MKNFTVIAEVKGLKVTINVKALSHEDAKQIAMRELGYEMKGVFFPLHWSEINSVKLSN